MAKLRFIFSLVREEKPTISLSSSPDKPIISNRTPLRIKVKHTNSRKPGISIHEYIHNKSTQWPQTAKCYLQIWELDKWKKGRKKGNEYDTKAQTTSNDLVKEIGGYIKRNGNGTYKFIADGPVKSDANAPKNNKSITLMIDTLENGTVSNKKVSLTVTGEAETCFEIGLVCEAISKQTKYKNKWNYPVVHILAYDDCLCYLSDPKNPASRCGKGRIHYYIEAGLGNVQWSEDYYKFRYSKLTKTSFSNLSSESSFEEMLRSLGKDLNTSGNKNKKIGDLIMATHGYLYTPASGPSVVKMQVPLIASSLPGRLHVPQWKDSPPNEIDAEDLENLLDSSHEWYKFVNPSGGKQGLITDVLKSIKTHVDDVTHIWLVGCNIGLNPKLMKAMRKVFDDKPKVYAFNDRHYLKVWPKHGYPKTRGQETVVATTRHQKVWTAKGVASIVKVS